MKHAVMLAVAAAVLAGSASIAPAQSLGDVAKKEAVRRKRVAKSGKVYTNDDLRGTQEAAAPAPGAETTPPPTADASAGTPAAAEPAPAQPDTSRAKDEKYWRDRMARTRDNLDRAQTFREALQSRINALTADFTSRDDPAQRAVIGQNRQKALAELERVNNEIASFQKQLRDTEEEARRAGVPPGWLR